MDYIIWLIIAMIFAGVAQAKVSSTYKKYSKVPNKRGFSGEQEAKQMLLNARITYLRV